jgi:hydroxymethylbilane synthase
LRLTIGSRGSQLALWQANHIAARLREHAHDVAIEIIHTTGDKIADVALAKVGAKGMFTKEIEEALADKQIDLAVHSLKDLPTDISSEFEIGAIPLREDPRDAFCSVKYSFIEQLPPSARIGTSSLRREAQLRALRPNLDIQPLRGNVDTRLRKLESVEYDAIILAAAGLNRLGRVDAIRQIISADVMCPAAGQGALAIEIRTGDSAVRDALAFMDDAATRAEVDCERALLRSMGGGCQVPIGASAQWSNRQLRLQAVVASPDGKSVLRDSAEGEDAATLGQLLGSRLLKNGGAAILDLVYAQSAPPPERP